jgi:hypothetical protein
MRRPTNSTRRGHGGAHDAHESQPTPDAQMHGAHDQARRTHGPEARAAARQSGSSEASRTDRASSASELETREMAAHI